MSTTLTRRTIVAGAAIASAAAMSGPADAGRRDPIHAALDRARRMEAICDEEAAANATDYNHDIDAAASEALEARMMLALTVPTSWAGIAALVAFVAERTAIYESFYFEHDEAPHYARSLDQAIRQLNSKVPR